MADINPREMYHMPAPDDREGGSSMPYPKHPRENLPTMYDLPSEDPEEPGLPDEFHEFQPQLLRETCKSPAVPSTEMFIGSDLNLYYDIRRPLWQKRPDWFLVLGVPSSQHQDQMRWSYVVWQEGVVPFLVVELLSPGTEGDDLGQKLRSADKPPSKWQVYEQILRIPYYIIYDRYENRLRGFELRGTHYQAMDLVEPKLWLPALELGLGVWQGYYQGTQGLWLRWYDKLGHWVPTNQEYAEQEHQRAEQEHQKVLLLSQKLRELGVDPDSLP